jgi:membrane-associated phospholipid phosphatase
VRRAVLTLIAIVVFSGYLVTNRLMDGKPATTLFTSVDRAVPFFPPAEFVYISVYFFLFLPVAGIRHPRIFERTALAFYTLNLTCIVIFWLFPVRYERPPPFSLESVSAWGVAFNYAYDSPYCAFPSLHVANAVLASCGALCVDRPVGVVASIWAALIAVSTLLVKEHFIADVVAGAALALLLYALIVAPVVPAGASREELAFPRRFTVLLVVLYVLSLAIFVGLYLAGKQPFAWPPPAQ